MRPSELIPKALVSLAPGTLIGVKMPSLSRQPWNLPSALMYTPTTSPSELMSLALVKVAPGKLIGVKVGSTLAVAGRAHAHASAKRLTKVMRMFLKLFIAGVSFLCFGQATTARFTFFTRELETEWLISAEEIC